MPPSRLTFVGFSQMVYLNYWIDFLRNLIQMSLMNYNVLQFHSQVKTFIRPRFGL